MLCSVGQGKPLIEQKNIVNSKLSELRILKCEAKDISTVFLTNEKKLTDAVPMQK